MNTLILKKDHINEIINCINYDKVMDNCITGLLEAYLSYNPSKTIMKKRDGFIYSDPHSGVFEWMPIMDNNISLIKLVSYNPKNPGMKNIPTIISQVNLIDTTTGHVTAIMDGGIITSIRTGAASAIASRFMAKKDSSILGLVGSGCQAITQLHAISREFNLSKIYVYDIDEVSARSFIERAARFNLSIEIVTLDFLIKESDIICVATSVEVNSGPVITSKNFKQHLHINAVGADLPGKIEISKDLLRSSYVCPDFLEQAVIEGECQQLTNGEIGKDIISLIQSEKDFENLRECVTVYDSTGIPLQDLILAQQFISYAKKLKIGDLVQLENITDNPKDPYFGIKPSYNPLKVKDNSYL